MWAANIGNIFRCFHSQQYRKKRSHITPFSDIFFDFLFTQNFVSKLTKMRNEKIQKLHKLFHRIIIHLRAAQRVFSALLRRAIYLHFWHKSSRLQAKERIYMHQIYKNSLLSYPFELFPSSFVISFLSFSFNFLCMCPQKLCQHFNFPCLSTFSNNCG